MRRRCELHLRAVNLDSLKRGTPDYNQTRQQRTVSPDTSVGAKSGKRPLRNSHLRGHIADRLTKEGHVAGAVQHHPVRH
jgi:hypothetical protein